jgi:hypothetical protein
MSTTTSDTVTLIYEGDHETLGRVRLEVTPRGYGPTSVKTFLNGQYVGRAGWDSATLGRNLKGMTLIERVAS